MSALPRHCPDIVETPQPRRPAECPVEEWLGFLGHRWNALVLWHLNVGAKRHGELTALLPGVSPKVLAERLDGLRARNLVTRSATATFPRNVAYELTPAARRLIVILDELELWSRTVKDWLPE